jgi:hypothetical protein
VNCTNLGEVWDRAGIRPLRIVLLLVVSIRVLGPARAEYWGNVAGEALDEDGTEVSVRVFKAG